VLDHDLASTFEDVRCVSAPRFRSVDNLPPLQVLEDSYQGVSGGLA
jgi:hypothetical protein